jgi:hypothetical protein
MKTDMDFLGIIEILIAIPLGYFIKVGFGLLVNMLPFETPAVLFYILTFILIICAVWLLHFKLITPLRNRVKTK